MEPEHQNHWYSRVSTHSYEPRNAGILPVIFVCRNHGLEGGVPTLV
jgi:hypothetical protein